MENAPQCSSWIFSGALTISLGKNSLILFMLNMDDEVNISFSSVDSFISIRSVKIYYVVDITIFFKFQLTHRSSSDLLKRSQPLTQLGITFL